VTITTFVQAITSAVTEGRPLFRAPNLFTPSALKLTPPSAR
jgi:hypothetical protein